jgi:hypothetical protein
MYLSVCNLHEDAGLLRSLRSPSFWGLEDLPFKDESGYHLQKQIHAPHWDPEQDWDPYIDLTQKACAFLTTTMQTTHASPASLRVLSCRWSYSCKVSVLTEQFQHVTPPPPPIYLVEVSSCNTVANVKQILKSCDFATVSLVMLKILQVLNAIICLSFQNF